MAFKRNEPGCRCCGFGLAADVRDHRIRVLGLNKNANADTLLISVSTVNLESTFGAGSTVIGSDPDRGRILFRRSSGEIWYYEARTFATGMLFDSFSDVGSLSNVWYLYYQNEYDVVGGFTFGEHSQLKEVFTINHTGTFILEPVETPPISMYLLYNGLSGSSITVSPEGDIYCGTTYVPIEGADPPQNRCVFLKNAEEYTYTSPHEGLIGPADLIVVPIFCVYQEGNLLNYCIRNTGSGSRDLITEKDSAGQITLSDVIFDYEDITGNLFIAGGDIFPYSQYRAIDQTIDLKTLGGWYRISKDLTVNTKMATSFGDLFVTNPGT